MKYYFVHDSRDHPTALLSHILQKCAQISDATLHPLAMDTPEQRQHMLHFLAQAGVPNKAPPLMIQYDPQTESRTVLSETDMRQVVNSLCTGIQRSQLQQIVHGELGSMWVGLLDTVGMGSQSDATPPPRGGRQMPFLLLPCVAM
jgi:hypothetical protein